MQIVVVILFLLVSVMLHEFGHLYAARFFGVPVDAYSIGFGPKLVSWKSKGTEWCLKLLPFGGSCSINEEAFAKAGPMKQILIFFAGPAVNFALSLLFVCILFILADKFSLPAVFSAYVDTAKNVLESLLPSLKEAVIARKPVMTANFADAGHLLAETKSVKEYVMMACSIMFSVNYCLFITNLLPIPGLDGGQILFTIPELFGISLPETVIGIANLICVVAIMGLMCFVLLKDVVLMVLGRV